LASRSLVEALGIFRGRIRALHDFTGHELMKGNNGRGAHFTRKVLDKGSFKIRFVKGADPFLSTW
jgi:hypothetical protein